MPSVIAASVPTIMMPAASAPTVVVAATATSHMPVTMTMAALRQNENALRTRLFPGMLLGLHGASSAFELGRSRHWKAAASRSGLYLGAQLCLDPARRVVRLSGSAGTGACRITAVLDK